jgi:hypothetical protein
MGAAKLKMDEDLRQKEEKRKREVRKRRRAGRDKCDRCPLEPCFPRAKRIRHLAHWVCLSLCARLLGPDTQVRDPIACSCICALAGTWVSDDRRVGTDRQTLAVDHGKGWRLLGPRLNQIGGCHHGS